MKWWQKALRGSAILTALVALGIFLMERHIAKAASSPSHAQAWSERFTDLAGSVFGGGLILIWAVAWMRGRKATAPQA